MPGDGSSATLGASSSSNMNRSLLDGVLCEIKGFAGKVIGKGRKDATPQEMVHGHTIDLKEEVVLMVDNVLDSNASLYLGQQGGAENFGDIGGGSWIVWPKSLVKHMVCCVCVVVVSLKLLIYFLYFFLKDSFLLVNGLLLLESCHYFPMD
ncbi:hypothetical protein LguiA_020479 [Lonicera macranthoides]